MGAKEAGQAFLDSVMNRIPEERRAAVAELVPDLAEVIGDGVMRHDEFSRAMDGVRAKHTEQSAWYDANKPLVDLGRKAQEAGFVPGTTSPGPVPAPTASVVGREEFEAAQRDFVSYQAVTQKLGFSHLREFNEVLDLNTLLQDPAVKTLGLEGAYAASVAARRQEAAKLATDAEIKRQVEEQVAQRMKGASNPSYPSAIPAGSPLDALQPIAAQGGGVDEYVDAYRTIVNGGQI